MTQDSDVSADVKAGAGARAFGAGYVFGIPVGDLGWFACLLMGVASGFAAFFAATFCAIFVILIWNSATHKTVDFALSYRVIGFPAGVTVLVVAYGFLGTMWVRRMLRKA